MNTITAYGENQSEYNNQANNKTNYKEKASAGLIPLTASMIYKLVKVENLAFEFEGIPVHDVIIMGNLISCNQEETKLKMQIFDATGIINITFFDRNESDTLSDIAKMALENQDKMVKIFGTAKSYKNETYIQGAKFLLQNENDFILHMAEVMLVWSHLKGEISSLDFSNKQTEQNQFNKNTMNNNYGIGMNMNQMNNMSYGGNNDYNNNQQNVYQFNMGNQNQYQQTGIGMRNNNNNLERSESIVMDIIRDVTARRGRCNKNDLYGRLKQMNLNLDVVGIVTNLCDNGYLCEEDDNLILM